MGHGASSDKRKHTVPGVDYPVQQFQYPVQPPPQPPVNPPGYDQPLHVPVSFYPDNVYSTSRGNGVIAQINRDLDEFDYRMTELFDGNRFFNRVYDPNIPLPPGSLQIACAPSNPVAVPTQSYPTASQYQPQPQASPPAYNSIGQSQYQGKAPPYDGS